MLASKLVIFQLLKIMPVNKLEKLSKYYFTSPDYHLSLT
jgi:hypothetical protein